MGRFSNMYSSVARLKIILFDCARRMSIYPGLLDKNYGSSSIFLFKLENFLIS